MNPRLSNEKGYSTFCKNNFFTKNIKSFTLLVLATIITTFTFAQGFHVGVKGGVNMYKIDGVAFKDEFKHSYNAGIFSEINFNKKWGIQPELIWNQAQTQTSAKFRDMYDEGIAELKGVKLNYLSIPLLLSFTPSNFISFQAGPQFGILMNQNDRLLENGRNAFKSGDLSMLGGVQLNVGSIKLGGRYVVGLSNINDIDDQEQWRNQGFQLYAGFRIL